MARVLGSSALHPGASRQWKRVGRKGTNLTHCVLWVVSSDVCPMAVHPQAQVQARVSLS